MHNENVPSRAATYADLAKTRSALREEIATLRAEVREDSSSLRAEVKRLAIRVARVEVVLLDFKRDMLEANRKLASAFFSRVDAFMAKTTKVETGQGYLIRRMDRLEDRVQALEARPRQV